MYCVNDLYQQHGEKLGLDLVLGEEGIRRRIQVPEAHRPGLSLAGFLKDHSDKRILIFGRVEISYIRNLEPEERIERLQAILNDRTPAVIVARRCRLPKELRAECARLGIPLFRSSITTMSLLSKLILLLTEEFAPVINCHGTLVEVFGVGILIQGESSVGKSEAALGLIERGHRLISDDVVKIRRREANYLEGFGADLTRHHMEIRGIGIINVAHLYGAVCVRDHKCVDLVVKLEEWDEDHYYDRIGTEDKTCEILGIRVPFHVLPVKPGRDVVLLLETIALNHRLKQMGYHSAREFTSKLMDVLVPHNRKKRGASGNDARL
ncbi:MAG: HPr kinase/phosphorylase [Waddliaceae bacterium]|nr:HPr kinase/phosphorylase [Waddliaceae bacterium]